MIGAPEVHRVVLSWRYVEDGPNKVALINQIARSLSAKDVYSVNEGPAPFDIVYSSREGSLLDNIRGGMRNAGLDFVQYAHPAFFWPPAIVHNDRRGLGNSSSAMWTANFDKAPGQETLEIFLQQTKADIVVAFRLCEWSSRRSQFSHSDPSSYSPCLPYGEHDPYLRVGPACG